MANRTGHIFIAPNGEYLIRHRYIGHGMGSDQMNLTSFLDMATLFPSSRFPRNVYQVNWGKVVDTFTELGLEGSVHDHLTPLAAKSFQRIEILPVINQS